jgi:MSHA biogenesis protein MshQ
MSAVGSPDLVTACKTSLSPTGTIYFSGGIASAAIPSSPVVPVKLTKPSLGSNGTVDLTVNLGGSSTGTTCTPASSAVTSAAKPWLQGNWGTTGFTADPVGRATFGLFKSADEFIYLREIY